MGKGRRMNGEEEEGRWGGGEWRRGGGVVGGVAVGGQRRGEGGREMEKQRHTGMGRRKEEKGLQTRTRRETKQNNG